MNIIRNAINVAKSLGNVMDVIYDIRPTADDFDDLRLLSPDFNEVFIFVEKWVHGKPITKTQPTVADTDITKTVDVSNVEVNVKQTETKPVVDNTKDTTVSKCNFLPTEYIENIAYFIASNCDGMNLEDTRELVKSKFEGIVSYQILMRLTRKNSYKRQTDKFFTLSSDGIVHGKPCTPEKIIDLAPISFKQCDTSERKKAKKAERKKAEKENTEKEKAEEPKKEETVTVDDRDCRMERESLMAFLKMNYKGEITDKVLKSLSKLKTSPVTRDMPLVTYMNTFNSTYMEHPELIEKDILRLTKDDLMNIAKVYYDLSLCVTKKSIVPVIGTILICMMINEVGEIPVKDIIEKVHKKYGFTPKPQHIFCIRNGSIMPLVVDKMFDNR